MKPRLTRLMSASCRNCSMRKWRNCTFLFSVQRCPLTQLHTVSLVSRLTAPYPVCGMIFCRFFALADSSSRGLWNTFFSARPSVVRHLRLSYPSLLDPADNIRDEVSSRIQYKKSLVVAIGFHVYHQFSCQVLEPIFPLCVLARH